MPLDSNFGDNLFKASCLGWQYKFAWLPHRCHISNRIIWLTWAYRGTAAYRAGDFDAVYEHRWHDRIEHLIWTLKK